MASGMWIAIVEIIAGSLMLAGLFYWLAKRFKNNRPADSKDNMAELLATAKKLDKAASNKKVKADS
jgi:membrane protein DedA with SNARE-associated domain